MVKVTEMKNLMFDTWDGQIFYPRFYDLDTICSYDNSGQIKFDVDVEMEQGYWNTSSSRLWTKIRDWMHDDLVEIYKDMRQNGLSFENLMKYFYDDQISVIPQTYYNKDADIKYIPYADQYIGKAHGDGYQHLKRWLKRRITFCDTLFDYTPSYTNDILTIRANTTEEMTLEIETYTPVYQHLSWYNNQMDKKKIDGKTSVTFTGTAQASTDQEVLIYGGSNIKAIRGISSTNPNQVLIGSATRLTEIDLSNCPILTTVNSDKANFTPHTYLNKLDISNCPQLGGILKANNSPLLREINAKNTAVTGIQLPPSIRNLEVLRLPNSISTLTLNDAGLLNTLEFDDGINLQSIALTNCNNLTNCINFDLTKTPTVLLDNSYNAEELYMSETTNLTLKNMPTLKRVIYTPNNEYEEFDINNVINGKNYKVTTFNNPNMKEFITTAPHRLSYHNGEYGDITPNKVFSANTLDLSDTQFTDIKLLCTTDLYNLKVPTTIKNFYCDSAMDIDTDVVTEASYDVIHDELVEQYTTNYEGEVVKVVTNSINIKDNSVANKKINIEYSEQYQYGNYVVTGELNDSSYYMTDYIKVTPGTKLTVPYTDFGQEVKTVVIAGYPKDKSVGYRVYNLNSYSIDFDYTIPSWMEWIKASTDCDGIIINYEGTKTPNIVPSSASGSLIFNLYSNNTTQPTSTSPYMWDLTGLKLNDFYTFGMNNWVKPNDDSIVLLNRNEELTYCYGSYVANGTTKGEVYTNSSSLTNKCLGWLRIPKGSHIITTSNGTGVTPCWWDDTNSMMRTLGYAYTSGQSYNWNDTGVTTDYYECYLTINNQAKWVIVDDVKFDLTSISSKGIDGGTNDTVIISDLGDLVIYDEGCDIILDRTPTSITMPQRLPGYSVRMVNTDITPNNYANHLYPLLVDTTLPITGKLDYSKYQGTSLAWAYAYTTNDVAITPLDSRHIGGITNDYNKLYGTDYIDIVDVWAYKDDDFSNKTTNEAITKAYIELTQDNYTTRIDEVLQWYPNCTDLYLFEDGSVTSLASMFNGNNTNTKNQIVKVEFIEGYFLNTNNMMATFFSCSSLTSVSNIPNSVTNMGNTFRNCSKLTEVPNIPNGITNMESTFQGCTALTTAPTIPNSVTTMFGTFYGCISLTTVPTIPDSVTNMETTFRGCTALITAPNIPNSVTTIKNTVNGCTSLTTAPNIGNSVTNMESTFQNCSALITAPNIGNSVTNMSNTFYGCSALVEGAILHENITNIQTIYSGCTSLKKVYIPLSANWISLNRPLNDCRSLEEVIWVGNRNTSYDVYDLINSNYVLLPRQSINDLVPEHLYDLLVNKLTIVNKTGTLNDTYSATTNCAVGNFIIGSYSYYSTTEFYPGTCRMYKAILNGVEIIPILDESGNPCFLNTQNNSKYYNEKDGGILTAGTVVSKYGQYDKLDHIMAVGAIVRANDITVEDGTHNLEYYFKSADAHGQNTHIVNQMVFSSLKNVASNFSHNMSAWTGGGYGLNFIDSDGNSGTTKDTTTVDSKTLTLGETYLAYLTEDEITSAVAKGWTLQ